MVSDVLTPVGMCGWALLKRIFDRFRIPIPEVAVQPIHALEQSQFAQVTSSILDHANEAWADSTEDTSLRKLAYAVRSTFMHRILYKPATSEYLAAGVPEPPDATMQPADAALSQRLTRSQFSTRGRKHSIKLPGGRI